MRRYDRSEVEKLAGDLSDRPEGQAGTPYFLVPVTPAALADIMRLCAMPEVEADLVPTFQVVESRTLAANGAWGAPTRHSGAADATRADSGAQGRS